MAKEIICDVMGRASTLEYGLVDAKDQDELEVLLGAVKTRWDELEKRYNNPRFHSWFKVLPAWMVKSTNGRQPHYVKSGKTGGFICDDQCLSYKSAKICSHSVAMVLKQDQLSQFLKWYQGGKQAPNYTSVGESGKPSSCGKKPAKREGSSKRASYKIQRVISQAAEEGGSCWINRCVEESVDQALAEPCTDASVNQSSFHFVASQANVQIGGSGTLYSPPPLIPAATTLPTPSHASQLHSPTPTYQPQYTKSCQQQLSRPCVESPFWLTFIFGNVSRCNGCKGRILRSDDKKPLPPPNDLVLYRSQEICYAPQSTLWNV